LIFFMWSIFSRLHPSAFDLFKIRFCHFSIFHAFDLIIRVTSFKC
jgi:hypothetical protein